MGSKSLSTGQVIVLTFFLALSINAHADVDHCNAVSPLKLQPLDATNLQNSTNQVESKTSNKTKSKDSTSYFGMFKLLIPDTLR